MYWFVGSDGGSDLNDGKGPAQAAGLTGLMFSVAGSQGYLVDPAGNGRLGDMLDGGVVYLANESDGTYGWYEVVPFDPMSDDANHRRVVSPPLAGTGAANGTVRTATGPKATINATQTSLNGGDTLWVCGDHAEPEFYLTRNLDNQSITLRGYGPGAAWRASASTYGYVVLLSDSLGAADITLEDLELRGGAATGRLVGVLASAVDLVCREVTFNMTGVYGYAVMFADSAVKARSLDCVDCTYIGAATTNAYIYANDMAWARVRGGTVGGQAKLVWAAKQTTFIEVTGLTADDLAGGIIYVSPTWQGDGVVWVHGNPDLRSSQLVSWNPTTSSARNLLLVVEQNVYDRAVANTDTPIALGTDDASQEDYPLGPFVIRNNVLTYSGTALRKHAMLLGGGCQNGLVENNHVVGMTGTDYGIVVKGRGIVLQYNRVSFETAGGATAVYLAGGRANVVRFNSVYAQNAGALGIASDHGIAPLRNLIHDNILIADGSGAFCVHEGATGDARDTQIDNNLYHTINGANLARVNGAVYATGQLAGLVGAWSDYAAHRLAQANDQHSRQADPRVTNVRNLPDDDWTIPSYSPARGQGTVPHADLGACQRQERHRQSLALGEWGP